MVIKFIANLKFINHDISTEQKHLPKNYLFQASIVSFSFISFNFYNNSRKTPTEKFFFQVINLQFYKN